MKQGILITSYKNFDHLFDIASFFDKNFKVFIHIDKKSKIDKRKLLRLKSLENILLISRKFKVNWGGVNHLRAILHLSEEALKHKDLLVFHLISGHDYPVKSKDYFIDFFKKNKEYNYISHFKLPNKYWSNGGLDRFEYYNLYDLLDAKKHQKYINKILRFQSKYGFKRKVSKSLPPFYGGETWWTLSRLTLDYVINYSKTNKVLFKTLKHSFCSEEIYFQTVIMNSEHSNKTIHNSLRYIDWNRRNGNKPANLDLTDVKKIDDSDKVFARKFEFPISNELKDYYQKKLRNTEHNETNI